MLTLAQTIQLWLIVRFSLKLLITNFTSIASFFYLLPASNSTCKCPPRLYIRSITRTNTLGSFGGVERLLRRARQLHVPGATRQTVEEYLRSQPDYTFHKPARRRFTMNHTYVAMIDAFSQADLADMKGIARQNGGKRYFLIVINVFSKFAWAITIHSKDAKAITAAFGHLLAFENPRHPRRLQTAKGKEFFNSHFKALMKRHSIRHFASESEQKAAVVQRFNRTIKTLVLIVWSKDIKILVVPQHRALGGCNPGFGRCFQPLAPPRNQYGACRCQEKRREPSNNSYIWRHIPKAFYSSGSHGHGQQQQDNLWEGLHAKLDQGALNSESGYATLK